MNSETLKAIRKHFDDLTDALQMEGVCISRECMCDTSEPIVKLNAAITRLEQENETQPAEETTKSGTCC